MYSSNTFPLGDGFNFQHSKENIQVLENILEQRLENWNRYQLLQARKKNTLALKPRPLAQPVVTNVVCHLASSMPAGSLFESPQVRHTILRQQVY